MPRPKRRWTKIGKSTIGGEREKKTSFPFLPRERASLLGKVTLTMKAKRARRGGAWLRRPSTSGRGLDLRPREKKVLAFPEPERGKEGNPQQSFPWSRGAESGHLFMLQGSDNQQRGELSSNHIS